MMAAITASANGKRVVLIDKNPQPGRKLLATGNGRCNLTNVNASIDNFYGGDMKFIETVISRFDQRKTIDFFRGLGLVLKEEENCRVFPRTNQASSVLSVLIRRLERNGVELLLDTPVSGIERTAVWEITTGKGEKIQSNILILATGGKSVQNLGSSGDGWFWAKKLGHTLTPYYPALVPMETVESWPKELQGLRVDALVWSTCDGKTIRTSVGDVLFTSYGVSGPAIMAHAGGIAPLMQDNAVLLHIDLFPDMQIEELSLLIQEMLTSDPDRPLSDALIGLLPDGLIRTIIRLSGLKETLKSEKISTHNRQNIAVTLKDITLTVSALRPYKESQVTAGGLNCDEIDPRTLQSRLVKGLYFAGEMLDCDGDSGGYNLQWAWSSGYVAGLLES